MNATVLATIALVAASALSMSTQDKSPAARDRDVIEAYQYMLGPCTVLPQETVDLKNEFHWHEFVHCAPGDASRSNPHLNMAFSEAWAYVDISNCAAPTVPEIGKRYYTEQVPNGCGETTAEINTYRYLQQPNGTFAFCLQRVPLPAAIQRVEQSNSKSRMLIRIELSAPAKQTLAQKSGPASNRKEAIYFGVSELDGERFHVVDDSQYGYVSDNPSSLKHNPDGSLTPILSPQQPAKIPQPNGLPIPAGRKYTMTYQVASLRAGKDDEYYPPALTVQ